MLKLGSCPVLYILCWLTWLNLTSILGIVVLFKPVHDDAINNFRITSALDSSDKQKASLDEWRKKCESIGDWMDSIEDIVDILEARSPSSDIIRAKSQIDECDVCQISDMLIIEEEKWCTKIIQVNMFSLDSLISLLCKPISSNFWGVVFPCQRIRQLRQF